MDIACWERKGQELFSLLSRDLSEMEKEQKYLQRSL